MCSISWVQRNTYFVNFGHYCLTSTLLKKKGMWPYCSWIEPGIFWSCQVQILLKERNEDYHKAAKKGGRVPMGWRAWLWNHQWKTTRRGHCKEGNMEDSVQGAGRRLLPWWERQDSLDKPKLRQSFLGLQRSRENESWSHLHGLQTPWGGEGLCWRVCILKWRCISLGLGGCLRQHQLQRSAAMGLIHRLGGR